MGADNLLEKSVIQITIHLVGPLTSKQPEENNPMPD
jgi:hypothetical protein